MMIWEWSISLPRGRYPLYISRVLWKRTLLISSMPRCHVEIEVLQDNVTLLDTGTLQHHNHNHSVYYKMSLILVIIMVTSTCSHLYIRKHAMIQQSLTIISQRIFMLSLMTVAVSSVDTVRFPFSLVAFSKS